MKRIFPWLFVVCAMYPKTVGVSSESPISHEVERPVLSHESSKKSGPLVVMVNKVAGTLALVYEYSCDTLACFPVRTGLNPGQKTHDGDKRTPTGEYKIDYREVSKNYTVFLRINYPNDADRAAGRTGGLIGIHYLGAGHVRGGANPDGSLGCITVWERAQILQIDSLVSVGTKVIIR